VSDREATIAQLLFGHLDALATDLDIAWPGMSFEPSGDAYIRCAILPGQSSARGLSAPRDTHPGVFQVDVVWPAFQGVIAPKQEADKILAHFPRGLRLGGNPRVDIHQPPYTNPGNQSADWYVIRVSIPYRAQEH
jgi:hypothetical protein